MTYTLLAFVLLLVIVGLGTFAFFRALRWQNRKASYFSLGCVSIVLISTLICGISSWVKASRENPYRLPRKNPSSLKQNDTIDNVTIGVDFYTDRRVNEIIFQGDNAINTLPSGLIIIELIASNESENQIEIFGSDLILKYEDETVEAEVVGYQTALQHLSSFEDILIGPGLPHEIFLFSPLVMGTAPRDYLTIQRWTETLSGNEFEYRQIAPSETQHGLVYFEIENIGFREGDGKIYYQAFYSLGNWGLEVTIHHSSGEINVHNFSW